MSFKKLSGKIITFAEIVENPKLKEKKLKKKIRDSFAEYFELSARHTTDPARRLRREQLIKEIIEAI